MVQSTRVRNGRRMASGLLLAAIGILLAAGSAGAAAPQGGQIDLLRQELDRTDQLLGRARDEIAGLRVALPQTLLDEAVKLQRGAWGEFRSGASGSGGGSQAHLRRARELTLLARERAIRAIEAAGMERRAREGALGLIDRAQDRAGEIGEAVRASGQALARQLLDQGLEQLRRARQAFQSGDPQATRLAGLALDLIDRAGRLASGETLAPALEASLERTEALLAEVESLLAGQGGSAEISARLREARSLLARARTEMREGHPRLALTLSLQARKLGLEILAQLQRLPGAEDLATSLAELETLRADLAASALIAADASARARLDQAGRLLQDARERIGADRRQEALAMLVAAETLLREAAAEAGLD